MKIKCSVFQGSLLGPLLFIMFIMYINDIPRSSIVIYSIRFADKTNLFYSNGTIQQLFAAMSGKLPKISQWFNVSKLSLNTEKTKHTFFHQLRKRDERQLSIIGKNLYWKDRINIAEVKIAKNIDFLYKAKN